MNYHSLINHTIVYLSPHNMLSLRAAVICSVLLASLVGAAPTSSNVTASSFATSSTVPATGDASSVASAASSTPTVPLASDDPNYQLWNETSDITPEPIRGSLGGTILGPQNVPLELQNADSLAPPTTDGGDL